MRKRPVIRKERRAVRRREKEDVKADRERDEEEGLVVRLRRL
jgi:hypothetical protein